jgi:acyl-CoA synthetase (AMP-forming)/AMP-acid ligase II
MVPTMFNRLLQLPDEVREKYDVSSLRRMVHAAAPCPVETKRKMIEWWGDSVWEYYAATEGGGTIVGPQDWLKKPGTVGSPWPGAEVIVVDEDGNDLPTFESGTVYMKMPGNTFEYKGDKDKTEKSRLRGFFTVGDIGYLDDDGFLFLNDRANDMIIAGGVNIYPAEIEGAMVQHEAVGDVAVFGIPNEDTGEEIKAVGAQRRDDGCDHGLVTGSDRKAEAAPLDRLHDRDASRPQRQALQAPPEGPVLGRPRRQDHLRKVTGVRHLTFLTRPSGGPRRKVRCLTPVTFLRWGRFRRSRRGWSRRCRA